MLCLTRTGNLLVHSLPGLELLLAAPLARVLGFPFCAIPGRIDMVRQPAMAQAPCQIRAAFRPLSVSKPRSKPCSRPLLGPSQVRRRGTGPKL